METSKKESFLSKKVLIKWMPLFAFINFLVQLGTQGYKIRSGTLFFSLVLNESCFPYESLLPFSPYYTMRANACLANEYTCQINEKTHFHMCSEKLEYCPDTIFDEQPPPLFEDILKKKTKSPSNPGFQAVVKKDYLYYLKNDFISEYYQNSGVYTWDSYPFNFTNYLKQINYHELQQSENYTMISFDYYTNSTTDQIREEFNKVYILPRIFKDSSTYAGLLIYLLWGFAMFVIPLVLRIWCCSICCGNCCCKGVNVYIELNQLNNLELIFLLVLKGSPHFCMFLWMFPFFLMSILLPIITLATIIGDATCVLLYYDDIVEQAQKLIEQCKFDLNYAVIYNSTEDSLKLFDYFEDKIEKIFYKDTLGSFIFAISFIISFILAFPAFINVLKNVFTCYQKFIIFYYKQGDQFVEYKLGNKYQQVNPNNQSALA